MLQEDVYIYTVYAGMQPHCLVLNCVAGTIRQVPRSNRRGSEPTVAMLGSCRRWPARDRTKLLDLQSARIDDVLGRREAF